MNPIFLFPTVIIEDELTDSSLIDELISYCNDLKGDGRHEGCSNWQSKSDIHLNKDNKHVMKVNKLLLNSASKYMEFMKYTYESLQISSMWFNHYNSNDHLQSHIHPNSVLSGVLYLSDGSDLQFIDPNETIKTMTLPLMEDTFHNSTLFNYKPQRGKIILFPSWLKHTVLPNYTKSRISLAFNIMFKGNIGSYEYKTFAKY